MKWLVLSCVLAIPAGVAQADENRSKSYVTEDCRFSGTIKPPMSLPARVQVAGKEVKISVRHAEVAQLNHSNQKGYELGHGTMSWPIQATVVFDKTPFVARRDIPLAGASYLAAGESIVLRGPLGSPTASNELKGKGTRVSCKNDVRLHSGTFGASALSSGPRGTRKSTKGRVQIFDAPGGKAIDAFAKGTTVNVNSKHKGVTKKGWLFAVGRSRGISRRGWIRDRRLDKAMPLFAALVGGGCHGDWITKAPMKVYTKPDETSPSLVFAKGVRFDKKEPRGSMVSVLFSTIVNRESNDLVFWVPRSHVDAVSQGAPCGMRSGSGFAQ